MKKLLVASTALVAVAAVNSADAAEKIQLKVGGFMNQYISYVDVDETGTENYADVLSSSDTEVYFRGSTTLDNGIKVAVTIDFEADRTASGGANGTDDVFMAISSDTLGKVELGATKSAFSKLANTAPVGGVGINDGDVENFVNVIDDDVYSFADADGSKINYFSPSFAGFQIAATYGLESPTNPTNNGVDIGTTDGNNYIGGATLAYNGEFSGVSIGADVGYLRSFQGGQGAQDDEELYHYGLSVGVAGFTIAGGYGVQENNGGTVDADRDVYDVGVAYATGPYTISAGYQNIDEDRSGTANDQEQDLIVGAVEYDLGAGLTAHLSVFNVDIDATNNANDRESFGVATGIKASF